MEQKLGAGYWDQRYQQGETGWDLGTVSPPLKKFIDQISRKDATILIPGCGNAYEAQYLLEQGFTSVTLVDISPTLCRNIIQRFERYMGISLTVICGNFFDLSGRYDIILEQTFFCALDPSLRSAYVRKMHELLKPSGVLAGVMFNRGFEGGPPFGGSESEYRALFGASFSNIRMEPCEYSAEPRMGNELFVEFAV